MSSSTVAGLASGEVPALSPQASSLTSEVTETATTAVAATTIEADKKRQEQETKLKSLSNEINAYMARLVDVEGADSAQLQAREMIQRVEATLSDDQTDLTHLITEATRTRNTVVNTVLRAYSGFETAVMGEHFRQDQISELQQILGMLLTRQKQHFMLRRKIKWITSRLTVGNL